MNLVQLRNREMIAIDMFVCRSDYWLMIYQTNKGWQFEIYCPSKRFYCNVNNFYYSSASEWLKSAKDVAGKFLEKIAEM